MIHARRRRVTLDLPRNVVSGLIAGAPELPSIGARLGVLALNGIERKRVNVCAAARSAAAAHTQRDDDGKDDRGALDGGHLQRVQECHDCVSIERRERDEAIARVLRVLGQFDAPRQGDSEDVTIMGTQRGKDAKRLVIASRV